MRDELIIGSHVSFNSKEQLLGSVKEAISYGENTFMFYTGAPQNTVRSAINDELTYLGYELMKENNIRLDKLIVHAPYIVNLANPNNLDFSVEFLVNEVDRCEQLGIKYLVLHPGSAVNVSREEAIDNITRGLNNILKCNDKVIICLETMAGKGNELGINIDEIKAIIDGIKDKNRIGVCLDTCHLNDSGIDINEFDKYLDLFDKEIGIDRIKCVHVNDSMNPINSHKDRHQNIGYGTIGFDALNKVVHSNRLTNIPFILETPWVNRNTKDEYPPYKFEIYNFRNNIFNDFIKK
jgi:deoxyribonuclease-4